MELRPIWHAEWISTNGDGSEFVKKYGVYRLVYFEEHALYTDAIHPPIQGQWTVLVALDGRLKAGHGELLRNETFTR